MRLWTRWTRYPKCDFNSQIYVTRDFDAAFDGGGRSKDVTANRRMLLARAKSLVLLHVPAVRPAPKAGNKHRRLPLIGSRTSMTMKRRACGEPDGKP